MWPLSWFSVCVEFTTGRKCGPVIAVPKSAIVIIPRIIRLVKHLTLVMLIFLLRDFPLDRIW